MPATDQSTPLEQRYDLFISYRHTTGDRDWAKWLVEALETYRTPKHLVKRGFPPRIQRVFRDEDELPTSPDLNDNIIQALKASRFLVVICSPDTPKSQWVEREIRLFQELGGSDRIIPLLVAGEPDESFPRLLRERLAVTQTPDGTTQSTRTETEPLAADVRPRPDLKPAEIKRLALLRIMAHLLSCGFDDLRQRDAERRRRRRNLALAAGFTLFLIAAVLGLCQWDRTRVKEAVYPNIVWRLGVPEGYGPRLGKEFWSRRNASYRLKSRGGKVFNLCRINGSGYPSAGDDGFAEWDVLYRANGKVERLLLYSPQHKLLRKDTYDETLQTVKFEAENGGAISTGDSQLSQSLGLIGDDAKKKSEITQHRLEYDSNGFVVRRLYQNPWGTTVKNADGASGELYEVKKDGLSAKIFCEDATGAKIVMTNGVFVNDRSYNKFGDIAEMSWWNIDQKLIMGELGIAKGSRIFDDVGNVTTQFFFGTDGKPMLSKDGCAKVTAKYDERGNLVEAAYFGVDGKPTLSKDGYAKLATKCDERGNVVELAFFGVDGNLMLNKDGCAKITRKYDKHGNLIEAASFGVDGNPTLHKDGNAKLTSSYDEHGNLVEQAYFGVDGKLTLTTEGYAKIMSKYDERGNMVEAAFFGVDGKPTLHNDGDAKFTKKYDERGNEVERAYFGVDGNPTLTKNGYAKFTMKCDEHGNVIELAFFGVDGNLMLTKDGYAKVMFKYDERGSVVARAYFGADGNPTLTKDGLAKATMKYDEHGNGIEDAYFGVDGNPTLNKDGYAKSTMKYDEHGNIIEYAYFGVGGNPMLNKGCAFRRMMNIHSGG